MVKVMASLSKMERDSKAPRLIRITREMEKEREKGKEREREREGNLKMIKAEKISTLLKVISLENLLRKTNDNNTFVVTILSKN